ncbi:MAG TPA: hypothetical protein VK066_29815 [Chloroflexota bacterium]|nr:hypothetical protein [Chloroflexota bacterium]
MIVTVVVLEPSISVNAFLGALRTTTAIVEPSYEGPDGQNYACYLPDLWRCLRLSYHAFGLHIMVDNGHGYSTSLPFLEFSDESPGFPHCHSPRVRFPIAVRADISQVLENALDTSLIGQSLFFFEPTVFLMEDDLEYKYEGTPVYGPISLEQCWSDHDHGRLWAESIYQLSKPIH